MPARAATDCLCDEVDDLGAAKVRFLRTIDRVIRDGVVTEEERIEIRSERAALKAQFRVVSRRAERVASGGRLLRMLANTGEITPKVERVFREITADQAQILAFPQADDDGPDGGSPAAIAA